MFAGRACNIGVKSHEVVKSYENEERKQSPRRKKRENILKSLIVPKISLESNCQALIVAEKCSSFVTSEYKFPEHGCRVPGCCFT